MRLSAGGAAWPGVVVGCRYVVVIGLPPVINPPINNSGSGGWLGVAEGGLNLTRVGNF